MSSLPPCMVDCRQCEWVYACVREWVYEWVVSRFGQKRLLNTLNVNVQM